jgi:hypothetical protein
MAELDELKIPRATRPVAEGIIEITDGVCGEFLDAEYAGLARQAVAKLARKRPSPLLGDGKLDEAEAIRVIDRFALQYRLPDGKTVVDQFLATRPDLTATDRQDTR